MLIALIVCATVFSMFTVGLIGAALYDGFINIPGSWRAKVKEAEARTAIAEQRVLQEQARAELLQAEIVQMGLENKRLMLALEPAPAREEMIR